MPNAVNALLKLLDLEQIEVNLFRGSSPPQDVWQRVFGGQVIGQSLIAAYRTVEKRFAHSLHAYFIRPGDPKIPILYEVDRARDGRSFTTRRVVAIQHGRPIFNMSVSFQIEESGIEHQLDMPTVPGPENLENEQELSAKVEDRLPDRIRRMMDRERPIEVRPVAPRDFLHPKPSPPLQNVWMKAAAALPDDPAIHQAVVGYASDLTILDTCTFPHALGWSDEQIQSASLDHAIWFHRPFRADDWLLFAQDSPCAHGARGFNRGSLYTRAGVLVASVAQEGLIRMKK